VLASGVLKLFVRAAILREELAEREPDREGNQGKSEKIRSSKEMFWRKRSDLRRVKGDRLKKR